MASLASAALLAGMSGAVLAGADESGRFPTGTFVSATDADLSMEFHTDGSGRARSELDGWEVPFTYAINGDLYTEMTFDYPAEPKVPATYFWDFDGETLTFELWGADRRSDRNLLYADNAWKPVETPRAVVVTGSEGSDAMAFPTGTFVPTEWGDIIGVFNDDGTCRIYSQKDRTSVDCRYGVNGDLFSEMSFAYPGSPLDGSQTPATYHWDFDGELLTFELWGSDPWGRGFYEGQPHRYVPEAHDVVMAAYNIEAGTELRAAHTRVWPVPGTEVPAGALTDEERVEGSVAAVPISKGLIVTSEMVKLPEE